MRDGAVQSGSMRRFWSAANVALFLLGIATIAFVLNYFAARPEALARIDSTKTRAYSLSEQTKRLLDDLEGEWTIAILLVEQDADPAMLRQIDEVLDRYTEASDRISVVRVDPTDPRTLNAYEALLSQLRVRYQSEIDRYDEALDEGRAAFEALRAFAQQQAGSLNHILRRLPEADQNRGPIVQRAELLALLAQEGERVTEEVDKARDISEAQPIADYETARSILAQALSQWSIELYDMVQVYERWLQRADLDPDVRDYARSARGEYEQIAQRLATAADPLKRLRPLELANIGRQIARGEAAVILGPDSAAVIPSNQLLPKTNLRADDAGGVSFDQRFRGEQLISATIRSLVVEQMPVVVFVHAEQRSLLQPADRQQDLVGVSAVLSASQFGVTEWIVPQEDRPVPAEGRTAVWVIVPPPPARSLQPPPEVQALQSAVADLIADGEPVLLSVYPSLLHRYGQVDPWALMGMPLGLRADTARVVFESAPVPNGPNQTFHAQAVNRFDQPNPISRALNGQQTYFALAVPVKPTETIPDGVRQFEIASVAPEANRWLEGDWRTDAVEPARPTDEKRLTQPVAVAMASQRPHPFENGFQRFMLIGSGGWMISNVADVVLDVGGGRIALVNPGNHELMLAAVAWLAGMDDLIAPSPTSQEVARLTDVTDAVRARWWWISVLGMPGACLLIGVVVWLIRRM